MSKTDNSNKVYVNPLGEKVMRITDIIRILAHEQVITWANMLGFKHVDYTKEISRTADVGTMMHAVLEDFVDPHAIAVVDYDEYGLKDEKSRQECARMIESFIQWHDQVRDRFDVLFQEKTIVGMKYGGTIDLGLRGLRHKDRVLITDYKSSGFYLSQFLQLAGYARLYEEVNGPDTVDGIMIVAMDKKEAKPAKARYIPRENMDPFMLCFDNLYETAKMVHLLKYSWWRFGEDVR